MINGLQRFLRVVNRRIALLREDESEASAVAKVILPILTEGLGILEHDVRLEESLRGTSPGKRTGRADLVVRMAAKPVLVVECKAPRTSLRGDRYRRDAIEQSERYAVELQIDYVLLTNGFHWILTKGRRIVAEASNREELLASAREFYEWLKPHSLWYAATGLVLPPDFDAGLDIFTRCRSLDVGTSDLRRLAGMRNEMPNVIPRIAEEVRKALGVAEVVRLAKSMPFRRPPVLIHLDQTFSNCRQGAWLYDPLYSKHRANETALLRSFAKAGRRQMCVRLFIVDSATPSEWAVPMLSVGPEMLREGWAVGMIDKNAMESLALCEGDVIGDYVNLAYSEDDAFAHGFRKDLATARSISDRVRDYLALDKDLLFRSSTREIERFEENCCFLAHMSPSVSSEEG